jgi:hypothetical protein
MARRQDPVRLGLAGIGAERIDRSLPADGLPFCPEAKGG